MRHPRRYLYQQVDQLHKAGLSVTEAGAGLGVSKSGYYQASKPSAPLPIKSNKKLLKRLIS